MLLGKVCKVRTGKLDANAGSPNGKYPFFTCAQTPLKIDFYKYDCECVLIAGNCDLNVKYFNGKFEAYQRTYIIESLDKQRLDTKYLYYYLSSYLDNLKNKRAGGVIKFIKLGDLTSIEIPNLELNEQVKRVHELETIEYRKKAEKDFLICYDSLIKSRFNEYFGDPLLNEHGYQAEPLYKVAPFNSIKNKVQKTSKTWLLNLDMVESNSGIVLEKVRTSKLEGSVIEFDTTCVLYSKLRPYLNKVVIPDEEGYATSELIALKCDEKRLKREYLAYALRHDSFIGYINSKTAGTKMPRANMEVLRQFNLPLPSIEVQKEFSLFINKIDKLKFINKR